MVLRGESSYIVVCRMAGGRVCERHYRARGHKAAAKLAAGDGAEAILSIEREDAEDRVRKKGGLFSKLVIPLVLGLLVSALGVAVFWFLRGRPKLW